jgi:hypothetical protein
MESERRRIIFLVHAPSTDDEFVTVTGKPSRPNVPNFTSIASCGGWASGGGSACCLASPPVFVLFGGALLAGAAGAGGLPRTTATKLKPLLRTMPTPKSL